MKWLKYIEELCLWYSDYYFFVWQTQMCWMEVTSSMFNWNTCIHVHVHIYTCAHTNTYTEEKQARKFLSIGSFKNTTVLLC